ncbi:hypothetical protein [Dyella subtropica]|uniref:hypothetical protein n=1 Tax=Dyella subtropica TaxID=2992127 RepID=UPI0022537281|nr:hypothetical protein [Dyella subtropica]
MNPTYKQRYDRVKAQVDIKMGRSLGKWGRVKAFFSADSLTDARKQAIHQAEQDLRADNPEVWLYHPHHVIGTTSAPGQQPTVYYRTRSGTFGHITQEHRLPTNIGREPARNHHTYRFDNVTNARGETALQEELHGVLLHRSRNVFRPISTPQQREVASNAHLAFPAIKQRVVVTGTELGQQFGALPPGEHIRRNW